MMNNTRGAIEAVNKNLEALLFPQVARHLTGRDCRVEFRDPYLRNVRAVAAREGETGIIQIRPDLDPEQKLKSFLHEAAHIRLHFEGMTTIPHHRQPPRSFRFRVPEGRQSDHNKREFEAEALSCYWLGYANDQATGNELRHKLRALLDWRKGK